MFGSLGFAELILAVLIFMGLVGVVFLFLRKSDKAEEPFLSQRPSIVMSESPSTASNVTQGEARMKGPDEKFCQECGNVIRVKAEICPKCGVRQAGSVLKFERSRLVAAGLAFFLGGLGFHKFYLGKLGMGIVYLLFCWTFVPMIAGFLECISYLIMTDEQFGERYG